MNKKVVAVVVTHNRPNFLNRLLSVLSNQNLEKIIVIDNSETDHDYNLIDNVILVKTKKNIGGSGGYNLGIKKSSEFEPDFVWVLDDDCIPENDALNVLLERYDFESSTKNIGFICSKVLWGNTSELCLMNIPTFNKDSLSKDSILSCSFVSVLIKYSKISEIGLPYKEFFIWYDDVEYTARLSEVSVGIYCENSIVRHYVEQNLGANYGYIDNRNIVKYKFGIRNTVFCFIKNKKFKRLYKLLFRVRKEMLEQNVVAKHRFVIYFWYFKGFWFNPRIEYI